MAEKKKKFNVEITDIFEPEQEDAVINRIRGYMKENDEELKEYFKSTDTVVVKRLYGDEAQKLTEGLKGIDVTVSMFDVKEKRKEEEDTRVKCPHCGHMLEFQDWRCSECYYEFPNYTFTNDSDEEVADE